jgi:ubiquitin carboxyl-terminal hydrolase 7
MIDAYLSFSVLVHSGDLNAGHYYAFLRPEKEGEFFKFDDDRVTRATKRETLQENFGGDYSPGTGNDGGRNQYTRSLSFKKSMNAYMLVYLRKSKVDEILVPVTAEDAPPHLRELLRYLTPSSRY